MISGILVYLGLLSISYTSNISNPSIIIKGILRLEINNTGIEKISDNPLILTGKQSTDIIKYMINLGYIS